MGVGALAYSVYAIAQALAGMEVPDIGDVIDAIVPEPVQEVVSGAAGIVVNPVAGTDALIENHLPQYHYDKRRNPSKHPVERWATGLVEGGLAYLGL